MLEFLRQALYPTIQSFATSVEDDKTHTKRLPVLHLENGIETETREGVISAEASERERERERERREIKILSVVFILIMASRLWLRLCLRT